MPYEDREPPTRRPEEDEEPLGRSLDRGRYESGRYREPSRPEYGREYGREREYQSFGRNPGREREYEGWGRNPYQPGYPEGYLDWQRGGREREGWERGAHENTILVRLRDTDFDVPHPDDVRGRRVIDQNGNDIGDVDDLIVDQQQRRVRFLQVTSGGFLGFGGKMMLIPVEAITRVTSNIVAIDEKSTRGFRSAGYRPTLIDQTTERDEYRAYDRGYATNYPLVGQRRGRGPKNYRRSDERIKEDINDRLSDRPELDASDVEVTVVNCEVTLAGTVNARRDKRLAEDIAENVLGVQNVENRLRVKQLGFGTSTDRYDVVTPPATAERPSDTATDAAKASR